MGILASKFLCLALERLIHLEWASPLGTLSRVNESVHHGQGKESGLWMARTAGESLEEEWALVGTLKSVNRIIDREN